MSRRAFAPLVPLLALVASACARTPRAEPAAPLELVVASTTDVHGRLTGWDYFADRADTLRGLARAATIVDSVRAANPGRVILLDAGDLLQGNPLTYVAARVRPFEVHPVVAAMNAMRYDAAAIGNHEFNYGLDVLERAIAKARFPFLAANTFRPGGARAFPAYTIVERAGVKVGIVGATTPGSLVWDRENLKGRLLVRDIVPEVRTAVAEARSAGAEIILVTVHSGLSGPSSYDTVTTGIPSENVAARLAREVPGIAMILVGHSHREMADTVIGTTLLVQPRNWATSVSVAHLALARRDGRWEATAKRGTLVQAVGHHEHPAVVAAADEAHRATVAYVNREVGSTPVAWRADSARVTDTPLIDFMLEVQRRTAGADLASTAAFSLDASLDAGPITIAEVARLYPYENTLRAVKVSGRQLREYLEFSSRYYRQYPLPANTMGGLVEPSVPGFNFDIVAGADYVLDISRPVGQRVTSLSVKGKPVADTDTFTLALNNYRQGGGGGYAMLHDAPLVFEREVEIRQLLIEEVERRRVLRPEDYFVRNWRLAPEAAIGPAYEAMRGSAAERMGGPVAPPRGAVPATTPSGTATQGIPEQGAARTLRVIATNDFHGQLEPLVQTDGLRRGGAAYAAAVIEEARAECAARAGCVSLLVDGGDMFQGTLPSNATYGASVVDYYNRMRYAAAALGNHEFDWTQDTLRSRMRDARFPILGANVVHTDGRDVAWIPDDTLLTLGGMKVGVIGVADPETPTNAKPVMLEGLRFLDPAPVIDRRARALRQRGAEAVVVLAHIGMECKGRGFSVCEGRVVTLAQRLTERVDAIVGGHQHLRGATTVNGIPIVLNWSGGRAVGVIDVPLPATRRSARQAATVELRLVEPAKLAAHPAVDTLVQRAVGAVKERIERPVTTLATSLRRDGQQYALGNLVADAHRAAAKATVGAMNNGGIRANLPAGQVTYGMLYQVSPFGNLIERLTVRGSDLRAWLERAAGDAVPDVHLSGIRLVVAAMRPAGSRILSATLDGGKALDDAATYTLALNDYMTGTSDGKWLVERALRRETLQVTDLDALAAFLRTQRAPYRADAEARIVVATP